MSSEENSSDKPELNIYPNPFTEKLKFEFVSPVSTDARIDIYDITGRLVKTVFTGHTEQNVRYHTAFMPENNISGTYIYRIMMGEFVYTGKVTYNDYK